MPVFLTCCLLFQEIVAMCILFMLAGYETTSTSLAYVSYLLATNSAEQDQLIGEIDEALKENEVNGIACQHSVVTVRDF